MSIIRDLFTTSVNSTMMSMNERFTYLQKNVRPAQATLMTIRTNVAATQQASAKNRRLAMLMERRLSAIAALKLKKKSIRQRLGGPMFGGQGNNMRDRAGQSNSGRGRLRNGAGNKRPRRRGGRNRRRSQSVQSLPGGNMQRSRSMQSLNNDMAVPHKSRPRSRSRSRSKPRQRTPSGVRKEAVARNRAPSVPRQEKPKKPDPGFSREVMFLPQKRKRSDSVNFRNRRAKIIGIQKDQRKNNLQRERNNGNFQYGRQGFFRGRGGFNRGRGRGRGGLSTLVRMGRNNPFGPVPTKEELDKELEQYMANSKSQLDKDIDIYMKENMDIDLLA